MCLRGLGRCCSGESAFSACSRTAVRIFRTYIDAMRVQCPPVISASRRCRWGILRADWLARPPEWQALCSEVSASMWWNVVEDSIHINFGTIYVHVHLLLICKTPYIHHTHTNKYVCMSDYMYIEQMVKRN